MPFLLDGNNLIGAAAPSDEDRKALVGEVAKRLRRTRASATIVFDGGSRSQSVLGSLTVRQGFAATADDDIVRQVEKSRDPKAITVVTSDRALSSRVRDAGGRVLAPSEFWRRFGASREPGDEREKSVDVDEWKRYFEDERNRGT